MATLKLNKEFSTKNDAMQFIAGRKMKNNFNMQDITDKYNVIFLQRGTASYTHKGKTVITGHNQIFGDKVLSLREKGVEFVLDPNKPVLIFVKTLHGNNKALTFYRFHGVFKIAGITTVTNPLDLTTFVKEADDVEI